MAYFLRLLLFLLPLSASAKDFGTRGTLFNIQEECLLTVLEKKLLSLSNVEFATEKALESIKVPKGLSLPLASANRSFTFDPSIVVQESIKDGKGNVIVPKGTRYNPLITHSLNTPLLFFNGGDPSQLKWAKSELNSIWILTDGSPIEMEKIEEIPIYFDQGGQLIKKLGIKAIPAKVSQEKDHLKVEEIHLAEDQCLTCQTQPYDPTGCLLDVNCGGDDINTFNKHNLLKTSNDYNWSCMVSYRKED